MCLGSEGDLEGESDSLEVLREGYLFFGDGSAFSRLEAKHKFLSKDMDIGWRYNLLAS